MTATEELRRMLDERGVEWEDMSIRPYACTSWRDPDGEPCTALEGADDIPDGKLSAQALLTPEQAIAATLGRGTCKPILNSEYKHAPYINDWIVCSACGTKLAERFGIVWQRYCPYCGARITEVTE